MPRSASSARQIPSTTPPAAAAPRRLKAVGKDSASRRERTRDHYLIHLRAAVNKKGRPYRERSISAYDDAVVSLDRYLTGIGFDGDFPDVDTATLNSYFRWYFDGHTQGGTNTKHRRLSGFFGWLAEEFGVTSPYADRKLARYAPANPEDNVRVYEEGDVEAMLAVWERRRTTKGPTIRAQDRQSDHWREFEAVRNYAILRLLLTGMRREQLALLQVEDIDLTACEVTVAPLKEGVEGHRMAFGRKTAQALARWLRMRESHKLVVSGERGWLWMGSRNGGRLKGNAIWRIVQVSAKKAGVAEAHPHMFRHTRANDHLLDGGSEGDLMRHMDWNDRTMVDRYAASAAKNRARLDAHRRGLDDRY